MNQKTNRGWWGRSPAGVVLVLFGLAPLAIAQNTAFTYQGKLTNSGNPASGNYDFQFKLFDALTGGTQIGSTITNPTVQVTGGVFTVQLDFGGVFDGSDRYLEICLRPAGSPDPYTVLSPRQQIASAPYAMRSASSGAADGLSVACVNCVTSSQIQSVDGSQVTGTVAGGQISGMIPVESVPVGSGNYIQNAVAALRAGKNAVTQDAGFDISGDGIIGGKLGIGTATPQTSLHIASGISWFQGDAMGLPNSAGKGVAIGYSGTVDRGYLFAYDYGSATPRNLLLNHPGGNVGIGTLFPLGRLHVHSAGNVSPIFLSTGSGTEGAATFRLQADSGLLGQGKSFVIYSDDAAQYRMVINGAGNIGVGTTTPLGSLHLHSSGVTSHVVLSTTTGTEGPARFRLQADSGLFGQGRSFVIYDDLAAQYRMVINGNGNVGIGTQVPAAKLDVAGTAKVNVLQVAGSDVAEHFEVADGAKPGMLVAIDPQNVGKLSVARRAYNRRVAGVISGANNLSAGLVLPDPSGTNESMPVALSGRVWVYCDASRHEIKPGDLLTSSSTPGHAMKVTNVAKAQGAIIGKAMTGLKAGRGLVLVLVSLQ